MVSVRVILLLLTAALLLVFDTSAEERKHEGERQHNERREKRDGDRKDGDRKEGEKKEGDKEGGVVDGTLTAKGEKWIEVKGDKSEKGLKLIPQWIGGMPDKGGGLDKEVLEKIGKLKVGSRVRVHWKQDEHLRVLDVKAIDGGEKKEGGEMRDGERREHREGDHK